MTNVRRRLLRTFVLAGQMTKGRDFYWSAALIPFIEPALRDLAGQYFDSKVFLKNLKKNGIKFNLTAEIVETLLIPRFLELGWLEKEAHGRGVVRYRYSNQIGEEPNTLSGSVASLMIEIGEKFKEFIEELRPPRHQEKTQEQLEEMLLRWLVLADGANKNKDNIHKVTELFLEGRPSEDRFADEDVLTIGPDEAYLCARFAKSLSDKNDKLFSSLADITRVALLTDVLLEFHYPKKPDRVQLDLVLDAPLLLSFLGVSGKEKYENSKMLINAATELGCSINTFEHCVDEAERILHAILLAPPSRRYGQTGDAIRRGEVNEEFVRAIRSDIDGACRGRRVQIISQNLDQNPHQHHYFNQEYCEDFFARITWHRETAPRERDMASMALIMRLRARHKSSDMLQARYVMVSGNPEFARLAQQYYREKSASKRTLVAPIMHQRQVATLLWLASGERGNEEISRRQLLSACESALTSRPELFVKVREEMSRLENMEQNQQLEALMSVQRGVEVLMDKTLGHDQILTPENFGEVFDSMRRSTSEDIRKEAEKEIAREKKEREEEVKKLNEENKRMTKEREEEVERIKKESEVKITKAMEDEDIRLLEFFMRKVIKREEKIFNRWKSVGVLLVIVEIFMGLFGFPFGLFETNSLYGKILLVSIVIMFSLPVMAFVILQAFPNFLQKQFNKRFVLPRRNEKINNHTKGVGKEGLLDIYQIDWGTGEVTLKAKNKNSSPTTPSTE